MKTVGKVLVLAMVAVVTAWLLLPSVAAEPNTGAMTYRAGAAGVQAWSFVKFKAAVTDANLVQASAVADHTVGIAEATGIQYPADANLTSACYVPVALPGTRSKVQMAAAFGVGDLVYPSADGNGYGVPFSAGMRADPNYRPLACGLVIGVDGDPNFAKVLVLYPK